jgi:hypothetical protein
VDDRTFFNILTLKSPHLVDVPAEQLMSAMSCEVLHNGNVGLGLTSAYVCDGLSVSLSSGQNWVVPELFIDVNVLNEECNIETFHRRLRHASNKSHLDQHADWCSTRNAVQIRNGSELWDLRSQILNRLHFSASTQAAVSGVDENHFCFSALIKRLRNLQQIATDWHSGPFPHERVEGSARRDSEATMNMYSEERRFICVDNQERIFCWHANLPNGWRLYYEPNNADRSIFIGYIGKHLSTVKFN